MVVRNCSTASITLLTIRNKVYNCGILSDAVPAKSETSVSRVLERYPHTVTERDRLGQTPLHLAADWSWRVTGLLQAGVFVSTVDCDDFYSIDYTCSCQRLMTVRLSVKAGSSINRHFHL